MQSFWEIMVLDNTILQYAIVAGVILTAYLFKKFIGRYVSSLFFFLMRGLGRSMDRKSFVDLIIGPVENFLLVLISYLALETLTFPVKLKIKVGGGLTVSDYTEGLARFFIILFCFRMLLRLVDDLARVMGRKASQTAHSDDDQLIVFFKDFLKVILSIVGVLFIIKIVFNQDISKVLAGLSIVGAAIALAARESLENLIASFIIFFDKPFGTGDLLKIENITGTIERIGLRSTRIRTVEKTFVTVPNKKMVDSIIDNLGLRTHRRGELKVQIDAKTSAEKVEQLIGDLNKIFETDAITDYNIQINEITQNAVVIMIDFTASMIENKAFNQFKDKINLSIIRLLHDQGVSLAGQDNVVKIVQDLASSPTGNA